MAQKRGREGGKAVLRRCFYSRGRLSTARAIYSIRGMWEGRPNTNSEQCEANNDDEITVTSPKPHGHRRQRRMRPCKRSPAAHLTQVRLEDPGRNGGDGDRRLRRNRGYSVAWRCQRVTTRPIEPDTSVLERKRLSDPCQYTSCTGTPQRSTHFYCTSRLSPGLWVYS